MELDLPGREGSGNGGRRPCHAPVDGLEDTRILRPRPHHIRVQRIERDPVDVLVDRRPGVRNLRPRRRRIQALVDRTRRGSSEHRVRPLRVDDHRVHRMRSTGQRSGHPRVRGVELRGPGTGRQHQRRQGDQDVNVFPHKLIGDTSSFVTFDFVKLWPNTEATPRKSEKSIDPLLSKSATAS